MAWDCFTIQGKVYLHVRSMVVLVQVVFYNKMSWFVSELSEKDISNVVVQCR